MSAVDAARTRPTDTELEARQARSFAACYYRDRGARILSLEPAGPAPLVALGGECYVAVDVRLHRDALPAGAGLPVAAPEAVAAARAWLAGAPRAPWRVDVLSLAVVDRFHGPGGVVHLFFDAELAVGEARPSLRGPAGAVGCRRRARV